MARVRLLHRIDAQSADRIDADVVNRSRGRADRHVHISPPTAICCCIEPAGSARCVETLALLCDRAATIWSAIVAIGAAMSTVIGYSSDAGGSSVATWLSSKLAGLKRPQRLASA